MFAARSPGGVLEKLLSVERINVSIKGSHILRDVSLEVKKGEVACLVGRNGAGKTTTIKSIIGIYKPDSGKVMFMDNDITNLPPHEVARMGMGYVPEDLRIFPSLTVRENIELGFMTSGNKADKSFAEVLERIYAIFPVLRKYENRKGTQISGGERRMLAISRALASNPSMLLLDEPFEGLAPIIIPKLAESIRELVNRGLTILMSASNIYHVPKFVNTVYVMERGEVVYSGSLDGAFESHQVMKILGIC